MTGPVAWTLALIGWCAGWLTGRFRTLPSPSPPAPQPTDDVAIVIPARNEARRLGNLLSRLDVHAAHDIVVVDDESTDGTAGVARRFGVRVVTAEPPPPGWTGKAHACWTGARATDAAVLVFLDADTEPGPQFVAQIAARARATNGLVSVQPWHRVERAYEQLSALPNLVAVLGTGTGPLGRRRWWRRPAAFGPVLAMPRAAYDTCGGHAAVRDAIAEDIALACTAAAHGIPVGAWIGGNDVAFRMYGEGFRGLVEGWSKNLATGAGALPPLRLALVVAWVAAAAQSGLLLAGALLGGGRTSDTAVALVVYAAFAIQAASLGRRLGRFGAALLLALPVLMAGFVVLFVRSLVLTARGATVPWRGRRVPVRARS